MPIPKEVVDKMTSERIAWFESLTDEEQEVERVKLEELHKIFLELNQLTMQEIKRYNASK